MEKANVARSYQIHQEGACMSTWKEVLRCAAEFGELDFSSCAPPSEYLLGCGTGDSTESVLLVLGLLSDRNLAFADSVAAM